MRRCPSTAQFRLPGHLIVAAACALVVVLTAGCGRLAPDLPSRDEPLAAGVEPSHVLSVDLAGSSAKMLEEVEAEYGGKVFVWEPGEFALVGLDSEPLEGDPGYGSSEPNAELFGAGGATAIRSGESYLWAGGESYLWAGGESYLWAGGESYLWAGSEYQWMPENSQLWSQLGLQGAHQLAPNLGLGVKVAVIDTGVDLEHPALTEALADSREWWDFVGNDNEPQESGVRGEGAYGHGTNVAGIVRQVAPRATILPVRVLDSDGRGDVADLAAAIDWAVEQGADVINLSLGAEHHVMSVEKSLLNAARQGIYVFTSTGNTGDTNVTFPATSSVSGRDEVYVVSVTSVSRDDVKSQFATFHSSKVELAAVGENVWGPAPEGFKAAWSGTSMASPMAAGAMALALAEVEASSRDQLATRLKASAVDIDELNDRLHRGKLGVGRLDIELFLEDVLGASGSGAG